MKCPSCGSENLDQAWLCRVCGKPLTTLAENVGTRGGSAWQAGTPGSGKTAPRRYAVPPAIDHRTIPDKIKLDYTHGTRDPTQKALEGVQTLLSYIQSPDIDIDKLLNEAADLIWRQFRIDNVAIGLRDPKDGLYRYRAMVGFREDALDGHRRIAYKKEQFFDDGEFHGVGISKYSRIYLAEDNVLSEEERAAFNRPALLTTKRRDSTDSLEGDYIDVGIYGDRDDLVGWIEISGTRMMKLPDVITIRWVEVIASIIAAALRCSKVL